MLIVLIALAAFIGSSVSYVYPPPLPPQPAVQYGYFVPTNNLTKPSYGWKNQNNGSAGVYRSNNDQQPPIAQNRNDIVMGSRQPGDTTLLNTLVTKSAGFFRGPIKEITFPAMGSGRKIQRITSIVVTDNTKNNSGGFPQIIRGGVGSSYVNMRFKSLNGRPIDMNLKIYGYN